MHAAAALALAGWLALGQAAATSRLTDDEIARQIGRLGANKLVDREDATQRLWAAGLAAEPALRKASESADAEVRYRARAILDRFRFSIFPDTPADVVALIQSFRLGDAQVRQQALQALSERKQFTALVALIRSESDPNQQRAYLHMFVQNPAGVIGQLTLAGQWSEVERLLELGRESPEGLLTWSSFLAARGKLDERIAHLETQLGNDPTSGQRALTYLYRAKGDLHRAREAAARADDKPLQRALSVELGDWAAAANWLDQGVTDLPVPLAGTRSLSGVNRQVELLSFSAAFQRLAGNQSSLRTQIAALQKLAAENSTNAAVQWYCAEALLLNDQPDAGLKLLRTGNPLALLQLLAYQQRFTDVFELANYQPGQELDEAWFEKLPAVSVNAGLGRQNRYRLAVQLGRIIYQLGLRDDARRMFEFLAKLAQETEPGKHQTSADPLWAALATAEMHLGLVGDACDHAGHIVRHPDQLTYLRSLFDSRALEAECWYRCFRARQRVEAPAVILRDIERVLARRRTASSDTSDLVEYVQDIEQGLTGYDEATRWTTRVGLATTCLDRQRPDLARQLLEPIAAEHPPAAYRLGDALRDEHAWGKAAEWYERAWQADRQQLAALWLSGACLREAGQVAVGSERQSQADVLALTGSARHALAQQLAQRGLKSDAAEHWERLLRVGPFEHHELNDSARQLAVYLQGRDKQRAIGLWERHMLADLRVVFHFIEYESYLRYPLLIHLARADVAIQDGDLATARVQTDLACQDNPADSRIVEQLVPAYERAGHPAAADALFERVYEVAGKAVRDFPQSAMHHNLQAWMAARSHRRLDEALAMARKAVELDPDEPNYLDTLAEVQFHRGDRAEAVRLSRRCVELAPREKVFQRQLERFQQAPVPTGAVQPLSDEAGVLN